MSTSKKIVAKKQVDAELPERRLSLWRVMLGIVLLAGLVLGSMYGMRAWNAAQATGDLKPWFASYVDVTSTPTFAFEELGGSPNRSVVLSFIVSKSSDACVPTWGGAYTLDEASAALDLDRRIARLQQQDGSVAVSFGGLKNDELAVRCKDVANLTTAYEAVIDRYDLNMIDLDLENNGLTNKEAGERRAKAVAELQTKRRVSGKDLAVWVTLPVAPQGMTEDGTNAVKQLLDGGVDLAGVNVMTMNYGSSRGNGESMQRASERALMETHRQLGVLYKQAGISLNSATLWSKIGATPMIGQNDVAKEVFTLGDAKGLNAFSRSKGIGRMSMWSANRDVPCGDNYVDTSIVSDSCSGVDDEPRSFAQALSEGFEGDLKLNASIITTEDTDAAEQKVDDPKSSPYPIWQETGAYLQGTKVVWRHNVYEAKWWTQGDIPDNPVLQSWETPWRLIGPVLPGEKPVQQATLPEGTYPEWSGKKEYETSSRVLFEGVPYQAKWWNMGDSPAAASSNPDSSPWVPLTQAQIEEINKDPASQ